MTPQDNKPKQAREIHFKTYLKPEPGIVYDMNKCSLDLWRLEQRWEFVEKSAYEQAIKERDDILERYRAIELANKEMSRNDHVLFGSLLLERDDWRERAEKLAAALKDVQSWLAEHEGLVSIPAEEALAEFEAAKK